MAPFDQLALDPSDPLAFLMNTSSESQSGDSSTEESYPSSSTSPSSRESPAVGWSNGSQDLKKENAAEMAWPADLQQMFLNNFNTSMAAGYPATGLPMAFQQGIPMVYPTDPYFFAMPQPFNAYGQQPFMGFNGAFHPHFTFTGESAKPAAQPEGSLPSPASSSQGRRLSVTSSSSSSGASLSPIVDHAQPTMQANARQTYAQDSKDFVSDLIARAHQAAGISTAHPAPEAAQARMLFPSPRQTVDLILFTFFFLRRTWKAAYTALATYRYNSSTSRKAKV